MLTSAEHAVHPSATATEPIHSGTDARLWLDEPGTRADAIHLLLEYWLSESGVSLACGRWSEGAISELMLGGRATLLPARYEGPFVGVRELHLTDAAHHLHIDLCRIERLSFALAPSVCLGFKPSFEVRLLTRCGGGSHQDEWQVSLMLPSPYIGDRLDEPSARRLLERARSQVISSPRLMEIKIDALVEESPCGLEIMELARNVLGHCLPSRSQGHAPENSSDAQLRSAEKFKLPWCLPLLRQALALRDASLVIFRERTLVEFKTERLGGVHRFEEHGHVSWQIGDYHEHHCHLSLDAVERVLFSAEPVSCQGGGLNYTIWFLTESHSGNPYRPDGYFSVTLNRPYAGSVPRGEVIQPVLQLFERFKGWEAVAADQTFLRVLELGPPSRVLATDSAQ